MKTTTSRLLALVLLAILPACSKKPVDVTGQIFVITKSRENIKMGGIRVRVIPDEEFVKAANEVLPWLEGEVQKEAQMTTDGDHMTALVREIMAMEEAAKKPIAELPVIRKALVEESGLVNTIYQSTFAGDLCQQAAAKFLNAVSSKQEVTTDADGRFSTQVAGKTWFMAAGERSVGEERESYLWIKGFGPPEGSATATLVISNESDIDSEDQFHALTSAAVGKSGRLGGLEEHRAAGKAEVSEKMKALVAKHREAATAAKANADSMGVMKIR